MAKQTLDQVERSLKRWHSRLKRAVKAIDKLERTRRRLLKAEADFPIKNAPEPKAGTPKPVETLSESCDRIVTETIMSHNPSPDLDIPTFLRRTPTARTQSDAEIVAELQASINERKRRKSAGRIAAMKAKQSGETKTMPLSGKAALAKIAASN